VYLIEANTNPSLEICSPLLARIIPELLDNSFRIALDPVFQPTGLLDTAQDHKQIDKQLRKKFDLIQQIKYRLIFDEATDGPELSKLFSQAGADNN
jgi:hypothetical protein